MPPLASSLPGPSLMSSSESSSSDSGSSRSFPLPARPLAVTWYDASMSSSVVPSLCRERLASLGPWSAGGSGDALDLLAFMQSTPVAPAGGRAEPAPAAPLAVARCPDTLSVGPFPVPFCLRRCAQSPARRRLAASSSKRVHPSGGTRRRTSEHWRSALAKPDVHPVPARPQRVPAPTPRSKELLPTVHSWPPSSGKPTNGC
jgi:hypothetical protein